MHQKDAVKHAWQEAGLFQSRDAKLQEFLNKLDNMPLNCWPEFIDDCRRNYPEYKAQLVRPIWNSTDKLLRLNLIRAADLTQPDEVTLVQKFAAKADPVNDQTELKAIVLKQNPQVNKQIAKLPNLPDAIKAVLAHKSDAPAVAVAAEPAAPAKAKRQKKSAQPAAEE